jgi:hypothetical protein
MMSGEKIGDRELAWHAYHWRGQKARQRRGEPGLADATQFLDELRVFMQKRADKQSGKLNRSCCCEKFSKMATTATSTRSQRGSVAGNIVKMCTGRLK